MIGTQAAIYGEIVRRVDSPIFYAKTAAALPRRTRAATSLRHPASQAPFTPGTPKQHCSAHMFA